LPVISQRAPLEFAEPNVVQTGVDEARDAAAFEGEVGGLAGALELAGDAEVDRLGREQLAEVAGFLPAPGGERAGDAWVAVRQALAGELALAVPRKDGSLHARHWSLVWGRSGVDSHPSMSTTGNSGSVRRL